MISDDDRSPPERDRTANRRWMIGLVLSLVFGIFGAVMALLSYMDRSRQTTTTIYRTKTSPPAATPVVPGASPPAAPAAPTEAPAPAAPSESGDKGKGNDRK